ncbi:MAG: type 4a pilus biogenesis protein PilO [Acidobacteriota bacterium]|jgi:type IV pilus assembly protein PilO
MDLRDIRLDNLSRPVQHAIFAGLIVCLAVLFYMYCIKGLVKDCNALEDEIATLEKSVAEATAVKSQHAEFQKELADLEERLTVLRSILPAEKETPTVVRNVQSMAVSSNLMIQKFTPKPEIMRDFYSDWPIDIEVQGNYNGLGTFFEKIGRATRLIDIGTISINQIRGSTDPKQTLTASYTATTFVYKDNQPDVSDADASGKKEKKP